MRNTKFSDHYKIENSQITLDIAEEDIPSFIKFLVNKGIDIYSVERKKSLEDYFLRITEQK